MSRSPRQWLTDPRVRTATLAVLLLAFGVLVAVYLKVINQTVHASVRIYATTTLEPGGSAALRVDLYRPDGPEVVAGTVDVVLGDSHQVNRATTSSPALFNLAVPTGAETASVVRVRIDGEDAQREIGLDQESGPPPSWLAPGALPRRLDGGQGPGESPRVRHIRTEPEAVDFHVALEAEGGVPVRFLGNRFFVRLAGPDWRPIAGATGHLLLPEGTTASSSSVVTDDLGLAELHAAPNDIGVWDLSFWTPGGEWVRALFEVIPSFDGVVLRTDPIIAARAPISLSLRTDLTRDALYYDVFADGAWLYAGWRPTQDDTVQIGAPAGTWAPDRDDIRLALVQVSPNPVSYGPRAAVRGVLIGPVETPDGTDPTRWAVSRLLQRLVAVPLEAELARALLAPGSPLESASEAELERLVSYLMARLRPRFQSAQVVYDDTEQQRSALLQKVRSFRHSAHWLLVLGTIALIAWIVARISLQMWAQRRRTEAVLAEIDDPELALMTGFGPNAGPGALFWLLVASLTIAGFCFGIIVLIAQM